MKQELGKKGIKNPHHRQPEAVRHAYPYTKIPKERALARTGLSKYYKHLQYVGPAAGIRRVELLLGQHIGAPSIPAVKEGSFVNRGDLIASIPEGALGANLHASISGTVTSVTNDRIIIEA